MRCLHCGKDVPLLKRLAGNEFCSDAHRREYQQEYSELALGRLLQGRPPQQENLKPESRPNPEPSPLPLGKSEPVVSPAMNGAPPPAARPDPVVTRVEASSSRTPPVAKTPEPKRVIPLPPPPAPEPVKAKSSDPAFAEPTKIKKPSPAVLQLALTPAAKVERVFPTLTPDRPRWHARMSSGALPQAKPVRLERLQISNAAVYPVEGTLELRESARVTPKIDLKLGIAAPDSLETQDQPLVVPAISGVAPPDAAPWTADHSSFTGAMISLGDFASFVDEPQAGDEAVPDSESQLAPTQASPVEPPALVLDPVTDPLPVSLQPMPAGKAKPVPVFGATPFSAGAVQIPHQGGLPLRPTMVLVKVANKRPTPTVADSASPALTHSPTGSGTATTATEPDLGLPELRLRDAPNEGASRIRKIVAAVAGVAALATGIVVYLSSSGGSGSKHAVEASTVTDQWISNFATDAKSQRKVSVLRSSMDLPAYRVEFEGAIQIKGLGWVYRAQDSKNFYVNTIELEKPGENPTFALVHKAVVNGVEQSRAEVPLPVGLPLGAHYQIRFEAVGNRFTTWVQGQKADEWTDDRLKTGGTGLYREGAEQFTLHGDYRVTPLPAGK